MATNSSAKRTILVTGDPICDHSYYRGNRSTADSPESRGFRFFRTGGGALLLNDLIIKVMAGDSGWTTQFGLDSEYEAYPPAYHSFCLWEPQVGNPEEESKKQIQFWRAVEPPYGYGHPGEKSRQVEGTEKLRTTAYLPPKGSLPEAPEIVVIDDAGLGFRDASDKNVWPFIKKGNGMSRSRWIVLKLTGSIGTSALWKEIIAQSNENLVLIVTADQLRRADVRLSQGLSWEATAEDLTAELQGNPFLKPLTEARHLIVTFQSDGAFWFNNNKKEDKKSSLLVFDAQRAEGEWARSQGKGTAFGFLSCFTAAIVRELCLTISRESDSSRDKQDPDLETALAAGLGASRELYRLGHGPVTIKDKKDDGPEVVIDNPNLGFPFTEITAKICNPSTEKFVSAPIPQHLVDRGNWMMLDEWQVHARTEDKKRPHYEAALAVAVLGPAALERFPVAKFGDLQTVDRKEIESLRTIRHLINTYDTAGRQKKPLSLGVFGPPGAGKSFGVTQIAQAVLHLKDEDILTFNLSQFSNSADLNGAFHRVRDKVLSGITPLIFWDEFDSQDYKWLQYLLAPMQDGAFQDGQVTHPIGKCVFIFAGATSPTFDTFGHCNPERMPKKVIEELIKKPDQLRDIENKWRDFVLKKGPDFKSRLVGYLNVLGPNQRKRNMEQCGRRNWEDDPNDLCCPIRRALFIRAQFKLKEGQRLKLDAGVLRALLEIPEYKAGARSLEFLCQHLRQNATGTPSRSNLPGQELLNMHMDASEFWKICESDLTFAPAAERLARGLHEDFLKGLTEEQKKTNSNNKPWDELDEDTRKSNFAQAARIPTIIALAGLRILPGEYLSSEEEAGVHKILNDHAEVLAEAEHNYWMVERMLAGWRYARLPKKDPKKKLHPLLIPYAQLPKVEKDKDLRVVSGQQSSASVPEIPDYIKRLKFVGYRIEAKD
jgi:hypothetical protein